MSDGTRLIVVGNVHEDLHDLIEILDNSDLDIHMMDCPETRSPDHMVRTILDVQGSIVGAIFLVRNASADDSKRVFIPICSRCKKIRDDRDQWMQPEAYLGSRFHIMFTHSMCPSCTEGVLSNIREFTPAQDGD